MPDKHIDHKVLSELQDVMEGEYLTLLGVFLDDSLKRLDQLHAARSAEELRMVAHSLKGSSGNMGAQVLSDLCRQLEERVKQPPLLAIEDLINQIDREHYAVRQLFLAEYQRISVGCPIAGNTGSYDGL